MSDGGELAIRLALARAAFRLDVDVTLPAHGTTVVVGPSGCGKTTLLRAIAGLEPRARGRVAVGPQVWQDDDRGVRWPTWRRPLGVVAQEAGLFEHLDVRGNLGYGLRRVRGGAAHAAAQARLDAAVALLGLAPLLPRAVAALSGGERQRVAIARALATDPALLLLDEPLASVDAARRHEVLPWLDAVRRALQVPMLVVTHAADEVVKLADHLLVLDAGRVRACGPAAQVLTSIETPVVVGDDAGTLIEARVVERDARWHLVRAAFEAPGRTVDTAAEATPRPRDVSSEHRHGVWVRDTGQAVGEPLRLRILARDVSLQLDAPERTSVQNALPAVVDAIADAADPSQALLRLRCGPAALLARVTRRAVHQLELRTSMPVWALVKAVAVVG